ncbi:glycosyl hydrolase family 28-related protein [Crenalkalicoccus roseus]|uniref:glycosyl hydrolase family 28-related protein n=1 Tax=Crenalkalicoccus roseus TaxID=1485588 RepID=UPI00195A6798|nr:glycosyl hydrolase family 28-related protein [Crenalkalicoccus roseus]
MPDAVARLRFGPRPLARPFRVLAGSTVRCTVEFLDPTGTPVTVSGVTIAATRPDGSTETWEETQLAPAGPGRWTLDLTPQQVGTWLLRGACTAPWPETADAALAVLATAAGQAGPPDLDGAAMAAAGAAAAAAQSAALFTAPRAPRRVLASPPDGAGAPDFRALESDDVVHPPVMPGSVPRSLRDKLRDGSVSVRDFGAKGDGVTDDRPAFVAARDAVADGAAAEVRVPAGAYFLSSALTANAGSRLVRWTFEDGATILPSIGARLTGTARRLCWRGGQARQEITGGVRDATAGNSVDEYVQITNAGPEAGYGRRWGYVSSGYGQGSFDIGFGLICRWEREGDQHHAGQQLAQWIVATSPDTAGTQHRHGTFIAEWNVVNRGNDTGWLPRRGMAQQWTGFLQIVPEGKLLNASTGTPKHVLFGLAFMSSHNPSPAGYHVRLYNGILFEPNSIHRDGRAIYATGSTGTEDSPGTGDPPVALIEATAGWQWGVKLNTASIGQHAVALGAGQRLGWLDGADAEVAHLRIGADRAIALGAHGDTRGTARKRVWSAGRRAADGDQQVGEHILYRAQNNPAGVLLTADGQAASAANSITLPDNATYRFAGEVVARSAAGATAAWTLRGTIKRGAGAASVALVGTPQVAKEDADAGAADWTVAVGADTTRGALSVSISGTGAIYAAAYIRTVEIIY